MIKLNNLSLFLVLALASTSLQLTAQTEEPLIQRVRIDFKSPTNYVRHLLLSFVSDNSATDGVDYGYDARNIDNIPYDLNWIIGSDRYVVQGVGQFHDQRQYPFWMQMMNSGEIEISLAGLENFETTIPVYIYDTETKEYFAINDAPMKAMVYNGEYFDRFHIAFSNNNIVLSNPKENFEDGLKIYFEQKSQNLTVDASLSQPITRIMIYKVDGKLLHSLDYADIHKVNINNANFQNSILIVKIEQGSRKTERVILPH
ncbi:hypothetical protein SAMN03097699_0295 [Flavobacteriaceae bacterium MAR_2010_188]|nr:hypothetical protein SAMN03097699_0295 [Flavobacteriaceae bacterium MAR_2010_188]